MTETAPPSQSAPFAELDIDPYPFYARLRREAPVAYLPELDAWWVTRWNDCEELGRSAGKLDSFHGGTTAFFGPNILNLEGEIHRWLRDGVDPPLRPKAVKGYIQERARPVAVEYVRRLRPSGRADATTELLEKISVRVVGDVLGLTDVDDDTLQRWFHAISDGLTNFATGGSGGEVDEKAQASAAAMGEVDAYVAEAIARLTSAPDDSALSHMVHSGIEGGRHRTYDDLIGTIRIIITGGFQEPGHGAAASLLGVLGEPAQLRAVLDDPATNIPLAVNEGLRWIAPFGAVQRRATTDIEIAGHTIPAGSTIDLMVGSANRDEARYTDPDRFDLSRPVLPHAAFGYGVHFCAGHFLGRQLEQIALEETFAGLPGLRLDPDNPPVIRGFGMRGVKHLPVVWDA